MKFGRTLIAAAAMLAFGTQMGSAQEKSTWDTIHDTKLIRVGCINTEPFGFKDPATGEWKGIVPAIAALIAKDMNVKWQCVETTWGTAIAGLQANQFDMVGGLDPTPQRALAIDFANGPLVYYALSVLTRKDVKADKWSDLNSDKITAGVPMGTAADRILTGMLNKAKFMRSKGNPEAIAAFASNRTDFVAGSSVWLVMQNHALGDQGKVVVPKPAMMSLAGVGVRKEQDKRWRDWLGVALNYYSMTGATKQAYDDYLKYRGVDPTKAPGIGLNDLQH